MIRLGLFSVLSLVTAYNTNVTTSGISAGAFAAIQYAVINSAYVDGIGVFAGGPYYCAEGTLAGALAQCTQTGIFLSSTGLAEMTELFADDGLIDNTANLATTKVYFFSGTQDTTVATSVVQVAEEQMLKLGVPKAQIRSKYDLDAGHGLPTLDYGVPCAASESPFLTNCGYDGAGEVLKWVVGDLDGGRNTTFNQAEWGVLDQGSFLPDGWDLQSASLDKKAFVYAPAACRRGERCRVHIVWHGCHQGYEFIGKTFVENAGYWQWAKNNRIVLLFPQAHSNELVVNPIGCFDWWGYTGEIYAFRHAAQMNTVKNMALYLRDGKYGHPITN